MKPWNFKYIPDPVADRILANSIPEPNTGCIFFLGNMDSQGYGVITDGSVGAHVHRIIYRELVNREIKGFIVHHKCRQKLCVNIDHLELLTRAQHNKEHGPEQGPKRMTDEVLKLIEELYNTTDKTQLGIAIQVGFSRRTIGNVLRDLGYMKPGPNGKLTKG